MNEQLLRESEIRSQKAESIRSRLYKISSIQKNPMEKNRVTIRDINDNSTIHLTALTDKNLIVSISALIELALNKEVELLELELKSLMSGYIEES